MVHFLFRPQQHRFFMQIINTQRPIHLFHALYSTTTATPELDRLSIIVSSSIGGLDDLESSLNQFKLSLSPSLVTQVINLCESEAPTRRLLRFFLWSVKNLSSSLKDKDFNHAVRVFAKKDHTAMEILISDIKDGGRVMESQTFTVVAEMLVKLGRDDEASGHARKAEGVVYHHKNKIARVEPSIYRSLLYGSLCGKNVKRNPSSLVPEALNLMMEMRSHRITPTSISYNILLSCLGRTRRVKESCQILELMKKSGCDLDWISYYLVARVLYLTGRFGKGNKMVDEMIEKGLAPDRGGDFEKGRELWDEAVAMGVSLDCSSDVLDPLITQVFKPTRKVEEVNLKGSTTDKKPVKIKQNIRRETKKKSAVK
ncbi:hypothetical protein COLO4_36944 [Corchorus olitorius]|uniref:Pentatricopeptide repeat-containing protein n=1 Tax=Corchorus olitorius TaxID=93759 RepID=A0A1R3G423_9ROSI|nr:hypothetical protein COLO4_36944 [Corchorus olitorius]